MRSFAAAAETWTSLPGIGYVLRVLQIEGGHDISLEVIWPVTEMERDHDPNKAG
jgi:hypothetical protein